MKKLTTDEFIKRSRAVHGNKYDYSKTNYVNSQTKVCIICPEHGEFFIRAGHHLEGIGCRKCADIKRGNNNRRTNEWFVEKAKSIHGDKYDYSKADYKDARTKVCIICPEHGEFWQSPTGHIAMKEGCPKCNNRDDYTQETWIKKARDVHGDKYDYSKTVFENQQGKVIITCPKHGDFTQVAHSHIEGYGCRKCADEKRADLYKKSTEQFIKDAKRIHGDKYDYSKVEYKNAYTKVCIICPEHGEFWQSPAGHVANLQGCPQCKESRMEVYVGNILLNKNIIFERQKKFEWLNNEKPMSVDFYVSDAKVAIEVQGGQHFIPVKKFGGEKTLELTQLRDRKKRELLSENGIRIVYIVPKLYRKYVQNNDIYDGCVLWKEEIMKNNDTLIENIL